MKNLFLFFGLFSATLSCLSQDSLITYTLDTAFSANSWDPFQIDIDSNGTLDFSIHSTVQPNGSSDPYTNYIIAINPLNGNEVAADPASNSNKIIDFSPNDTILCDDIVWFSDPAPSPAFPIQWVFGESDDHFDTIANHYIGFRLIDQEVVKTGWLKYSAFNGVTIHLKSVGYMESCSDIILDGIPTGFNDNRFLDQKTIVYPNPVNDYFTISLKNNKQSYLQVLDITGKIIYRESFMNKTVVASSTFKKGMYFIQIRNDGNNIFKKVIKE